VSRVVAPEALDAEVASLAASLRSHSPAALRLGKEAVYTLCEMEYQTSLSYLREMVVLASRTEDAQEGIRAFFEKRKPTWKGR
jgi:enoyl-CoA hydratase/carnithine racemase